MDRLPLKLILAVACMLLTGCCGRDAKPVTIYQNGDLDKSCDQIKSDLLDLQKQADNLFPHTDKGFTNSLWGTAGMFFVVPLFGMDLKNAEKVEFEAIVQRHNYLLDVAGQKNCSLDCQPMPSLEQLRATQKKQKQ